MINIYCENSHKSAVLLAAKAVFKYFGVAEHDVEAEIGLISEEEMLALNTNSRAVEKVTDVLSFPSLEKVIFPFVKEAYPADINPESGCVMLGEVYICLERAKEQAEEYGHSLSRELGFLTAHGLLHLLGFDHEKKEDAEVMERSQEMILAAAGLTREVKDEDIQARQQQHTGFIAILGRPNAGKSTLINTLVGEKVSIVSWKPQTTRNKILGVRNEDNYQFIFVDTPGLHAPKNALGQFMMRSVTSALESVDAVIYLVDGEKGLSREDKANICRYIEEGGKKVVVAVNKIDHITRERVGEILTGISELQGLAAVVPISALRGKNIAPLIAELKKLIGVGEKLFPDEMYTDRSVRFLASEIIREKAFRLL
ncbi:MAG: GTPase Era, partial [Clostridia bacterium]|nr:GTPase Era [Clostridia bacterium]